MTVELDDDDLFYLLIAIHEFHDRECKIDFDNLTTEELWEIYVKCKKSWD